MNTEIGYATKRSTSRVGLQHEHGIENERTMANEREWVYTTRNPVLRQMNASDMRPRGLRHEWVDNTKRDLEL